jgi:signal recognition particle receptor subunit beta
VALDAPQPESVKVVVAGGFGTGKTTLVGSVSEIPPLTTEELLTTASVGVDDLAGVEGKRQTTVTLDFGRITFDPTTAAKPQVVLYLFGTPGQERFWFMWDELARGAAGAMVLVDTRRLDTSFAAVDYFEQRGIPFIVAVNRFHGECGYTVDEIRGALGLDPTVPIVMCDARDRDSSKAALIALISHALSRVPVAS